MSSDQARSPENPFEKERYHRILSNQAKLAELVPEEERNLLLPSQERQKTAPRPRKAHRAAAATRRSGRLSHQAAMAAATEKENEKERDIKALRSAVLERDSDWREEDLAQTLQLLYDQGIRPSDITAGLDIKLQMTREDIVAWGVRDVAARKLLAKPIK